MSDLCAAWGLLAGSELPGTLLLGRRVNKSPRQTIGQAGLAGSWPRCVRAECTLRRVPLDWSDAAGGFAAGYWRTRARMRTSTKTLWELCTMIPISALR